MYNYTQNSRLRFLFLLVLTALFTNCKDKDCNVVNADFDISYLRAGMRSGEDLPEQVKLVPRDLSANSYTWNIEGVIIEQIEATVDFDQTGDFDVSLTARKGSDECVQSDVIKIRDFPINGSNRAISFFESNGSSSSLMTQVLGANAPELTAIEDLPEQGGGMDVDNSENKIFASPNVFLASCFPNNADLQTPVSSTAITGTFFDLTLDPDDDLVYFTLLDGSTFSIMSTDMYNENSMEIQEVYSEDLSEEFVYITNDRKDNVLYWVEKGSSIVRSVINGNNDHFLELVGGGIFGDIDFDDTTDRLYFVGRSGSSSFIQSIKTDFTGERVDVGPINGDIPFIYLDEDHQELFWAEDAQNTISSKLIGASGSTVLVDNLSTVRGLTVGFYSE